MASYPDGNGAGANGAAHARPPSLSPNPPPPPTTAQQQHQLPPQQPYDASTVSQATITAAAAHHGLHALQAATLASAAVSATGPGPATSVYPPLASPPHSDQQFAPRNGLPPPNTGSVASRQTRLRRACDMCSNRKVKVS